MYTYAISLKKNMQTLNQPPKPSSGPCPTTSATRLSAVSARTNKRKR